MQKYQNGGGPKKQTPGGPKLYSTDSRKEKKQKLKGLATIKTKKSQLAKIRDSKNETKKIKVYLQKGGSMKSVPADKKFNGLRSLPTDVRNKMGYAQYGGMKMVKGGSLRRSRKY